jgi:hypothetical protein
MDALPQQIQPEAAVLHAALRPDGRIPGIGMKAAGLEDLVLKVT